MTEEFKDPCPHCGFELDRGDIYEQLLSLYNGDQERALVDAGYFGWSKENKTRFTKKIGIYDFDLDVTTHYICPNCKGKIERGRFET